MKFDTPATTNPIDRLKVVGKATDRIDGPLKTTGTAPYAYERHDVAPNQAYGFIVGSAIAKGRIVSIDLTEARKAPGVVAIVTHENAGKVAKPKSITAKLLAGPEVEHYDQAVAVVVAETFEQARHAASLVRVDYAREKGRFDLAAQLKSAPAVSADSGEGSSSPAIERVGDLEKAFAAAPVKMDETYTTPDQSHMSMEPHATTAAWSGDQLTLWTSNQMVAWAVRDLSEALGMPKDKVRIVSPFIGGGFGSKLWIRSDAVMAALGARAAGRPVKIALARPQVMNNTTHRPATIQRIRIGAGKDGKIAAIAHESWSGDLPGGGPETATGQTKLLYAGDNRLIAMRLAVLDLPEGNAMRAPGEAPGMMALEIAIDEMAEKLGLDPIEFRILNDTQVDPHDPKRPFSHRNLTGCLRLGAERFGWQRRNPRADTRRPVAGRSWRRSGLPQQSSHQIGRAGRHRQQGRRDGRDRHDRHRHRQLYHRRPDRGRNDGRAPRPSGRVTGRFPLPGLVRLRRPMGRQQRNRRRLRGVHEAAHSCRPKARFRSPDRCIRRRASALGQSQCKARRCGWRSRALGRGRHRIWRPRQALSAIDLRRAFCRGARGRGDRRSALATHARRLRRRPNPQSKVSAQSGNRRDDDGRRRSADGRGRRGQALRLLRQS